MALMRAREAGVSLSRLASSWAPFLIHASRFVRPGGRVAMVAPAELTHAAYARPVLSYLRRTFRTTHVLTFSRRLFPGLSEDTVLLLAAGRGEPFDSFKLIDLPGAEVLARWPDPEGRLPEGLEIDVSSTGLGPDRLLHYLLPRRTRELYHQLRESVRVVALGEMANVGIGYVTGDNDFFHLNKNTIAAFGLPSRLLRPAACSGSELVGLRYSYEDWKALQDRGSANSLLYIADGQPLPEALAAYLLQGVRRGVPNRYKCRVRKPWYRVPHVYQADGFLTYMSGLDPKLVANEASAVAPNTLHIVRLNAGCPLTALQLAALWQTSLSALSCELEGHSLGGGMLKLEPTEARQVLVATPDPQVVKLEELASELDELLRAGRSDEARDLADAIVLRDGLGLSPSDVQQLRAGWLQLRARRLNP